jgi:hypothetical protein
MIVPPLLAVVFLVILGSAVSHRRPSLKVLDADPLTVYGAHFVPNEEVGLSAGSGTVVFIHANSTGAFAATLADRRGRGCGAFYVRDTGSKGSAASVKVPRAASAVPCAKSR